MINKITDSISKTINCEFGDEYEIYTETVKQGLKEPCFSITCINPTNNLFRQDRYFRKNQFCIHYFPSTQNKKEECQEVVERLYDCLQYIEIDKETKTMGTDMHSEYLDGVLSFFVNYDMYVDKKKKEEIPKIENFNYNTNVKER